MRVAVLHNEVEAGAGADDRDVLDQVEAVSEALRDLGHTSEAVACTLDLRALRQRFEAERPDVVFNLVESLDGHDRLLHLAAAVLDALGLPYTGGSTEALVFTTNKLLTKERLWAAGLPAPAVLATWPEARLATLPERSEVVEQVILKSVWDHGSAGLDDDAVVPAASASELRSRLAELLPRLGGSGFAEVYVEGRELNLSLLAADGGPQVLPPAEIDFVDFPAGKPRILGWNAKWQPESFECRNTVRTFDFAPGDRALLAELSRLARVAWRRFGLAGYARVDFRVDEAGRPWILEINVNPCLAPDAGFAAAVERAGLTYRDAVARILDDAMRRHPAPPPARLRLVESVKVDNA